MKLYSGPLSLYSRKVEIALHEKGLTFERVAVPFSQAAGYSPKHPDVMAANPKRQIPVLHDGGLVLYDSTVILEYLEDAYPVPPLYPRAPVERALCRQLELYADEVMLVPLRALMHRRGRHPDPQLRAAAEAEGRAAEQVIAEQHEFLAGHLRGRDCLGGGEATAADIAAFMSVLFSNRLGGPALEAGHALLAWYERLIEPPSLRQGGPRNRRRRRRALRGGSSPGL